jgi:hypothetical protein
MTTNMASATVHLQRKNDQWWNSSSVAASAAMTLITGHGICSDTAYHFYYSHSNLVQHTSVAETRVVACTAAEGCQPCPNCIHGPATVAAHQSHQTINRTTSLSRAG